MVPYYTPYGASQYNYVPTKSNYLSNQQLGSFSYDVNEPRYQQLYKRYYDFFNKNLERIQNISQLENVTTDNNGETFRKKLNPDSYRYD